MKNINRVRRMYGSQPSLKGYRVPQPDVEGVVTFSDGKQYQATPSGYRRIKQEKQQ